MNFTDQEVEDLLSAISEAQAELCVDTTGSSKFPEATSYDKRLNTLAFRFAEYKRRRAA